MLNRFLIFFHVCAWSVAAIAIFATIIFYHEIDTHYVYFGAVLRAKVGALSNLGFAVVIVIAASVSRWILQGKWIWNPIRKE